MNTSDKLNKANQYAAVLALAASLTMAPAALANPDFQILSASHAEEATSNEQTVTASDGATVTGVKVLEEGKAIEVSGTGWKHPNGTGSYISVKADKGTLTKDGNGVIAETEADAEGNFKLTITFPTTANGYNTDWAAGTSHTLHFLSGSAKDSDAVRSPILKITVAEAGADPSKVVDTSDWTELKAEEATIKIRPYTTGTGSKLRLIGQGWTKEDGKTGSVVAIKLASSSTTFFERSDNSAQNAYLKSLGKSELGDDHTAWVLLTSDASAVNEAAGIYLLKDDGSFDLEIDAPEALQTASAGQYLTVQALSGRFAEGDTKRSAVSATIPVDGKAYTEENNNSGEKCVTSETAPSMKIVNTTVEAGGQLHLVGSGWCNPDGNGAPRIAIKIDEAKISRTDSSVHSNKTIWAIIDPNETTGEVDTYVQLPKADGSDSNIVLSEGAHSLRLLSGSLEAGDLTVTYGGVGVLDFNIGEYKPNELPDTVSDSDLSDSQQQGVTLSRQGNQITVTIPQAEEGQWVAVTPYDSGSVRSSWGSGWMQVSADKTITYTLPDGLPAATYKFAVQSGESASYGNLLGWAALTIEAAAEPAEENNTAQQSKSTNSSATNQQTQQSSGTNSSTTTQTNAPVQSNSQRNYSATSTVPQAQPAAYSSVLLPTATYYSGEQNSYAATTTLGSVVTQPQTTQKITKVAVASAPITAQAIQETSAQKPTNKVQAVATAPATVQASSDDTPVTASTTENESTDALLTASEVEAFWNSTTINNALLVTAALVVIGVLLIPNRRQH